MTLILVGVATAMVTDIDGEQRALVAKDYFPDVKKRRDGNTKTLALVVVLD